MFHVKHSFASCRSSLAVQILLELLEVLRDQAVRVGAQLHRRSRLEAFVCGYERVHALRRASVRLDELVDEGAAGLLVYEADVRQDGQEAEVHARGQRGGTPSSRASRPP